MKSSMPVSASRREFIKNTGKLAAVSALANVAIPAVHAAGSDLIQVALIGCGGRGGGAAANALSVKRAPVKLVAMADIFPDRLQKDLTKLQMQFASQVDVPPERQFIGFDAYQKAMDCLKPGDVAIFATPPAFRWVHFAYAIQKGLNVFMEKPLTADGPTSKRMLNLAHSIKLMIGLMRKANANISTSFPITFPPATSLLSL
jgi:predicted dehydrogenase